MQQKDLQLTMHQKLEASTYYATHPGSIPDLSLFSFFQHEHLDSIFKLLQTILKKPEDDFQSQKQLIIQFIHTSYKQMELQNKNQFRDLINILLSRLTFFNKLPPLSLNFLQKLSPQNFQQFDSITLQQQICKFFTSVYPSTFNASSIIINFSRFNTTKYAFLYANFKINPQIFSFLNQSPGNVLLLKEKISQNHRSFDFIPLLQQKSAFWIRNLPSTLEDIEYLNDSILKEEITNKQDAFCALFVTLVQLLSSSPEINLKLPEIQALEGLYSIKVFQKIKECYARMGLLQTDFYAQSFENCFYGTIMTQKSYNMQMTLKQVVYYCFMGRKYQYFIQNAREYVPKSVLIQANKGCPNNILKGLFMMQCTEQEKSDFQSKNFIFPLQQTWKNPILTTFRALERAVAGDFVELNELFIIIKSSYPEQIVAQLCKKHSLKHKFHVQTEKVTILNDNILILFLEQYTELIPVEGRKSLQVLIDLINQVRVQLSAQSFISNQFYTLFHPNMRAKIDEELLNCFQNIENENFDELKNIVVPLQIGEFLGENDEKYVLCNGICFILVLFTGEFETKNQYILLKYILLLCDKYSSLKKLYKAAFSQIDYSETNFYSKYFTSNQVYNGVQKAYEYIMTNFTPFVERKREFLPQISGLSIFNLFKHLNQNSIFQFNQNKILVFEVNQIPCQMEEQQLKKLIKKYSISEILDNFHQLNFSLPSIQLLKIFSNQQIQIQNYTFLANCRYEFQDVFDLVLEKIQIQKDIKRLISLCDSKHIYIILSKLLSLGQTSVNKALSQAQNENDIEMLLFYPFKNMHKVQQCKLYGRVIEFQRETIQDINQDIGGLKYALLEQ
eukprot:EST44418.1 Hypothetical protein SS50377_15724 [Spironucleus salmonicida]